MYRFQEPEQALVIEDIVTDASNIIFDIPDTLVNIDVSAAEQIQLTVEAIKGTSENADGTGALEQDVESTVCPYCAQCTSY